MEKTTGQLKLNKLLFHLSKLIILWCSGFVSWLAFLVIPPVCCCASYWRPDMIRDRSHIHIRLGLWASVILCCVFVAVVSHWENASTWLSVMFIFISLKTPRIQSSFGYLWLNNFPFSFPGEKKSVYLLLEGGRMITAQAGWLGQLSTAALCCWDGWERVTSHSVVPRRTSFSLLLELAHSHSLLAETLQS